MRDITHTFDTLQRDANELVELQLVLERTADVFAADDALPAAHDALAQEDSLETATHERASLLGGEISQQICGVLTLCLIQSEFFLFFFLYFLFKTTIR